MIRKKSENHGPIVIDLTGPDGNAFMLLGYARRLAKQLGYGKEQTEFMLSKMMEGDYENLLEVFDSEFGDYVILER